MEGRKINPNQKKGFKTIGRPTEMTPETIQKLRDGFCYSLTDAEACLYAGISTTTFYNRLEKNPEFREEKEMLKRKLIMKSKFNVGKSINVNDLDNSKRWLETKGKDEFSKRNENTGKDGLPIQIQEVPLTLQQKKVIAQQVLDSVAEDE